jgi:acyl-coenzyme A synthetase/AMP-(fatty) acid ligase/acyl carrier protein
MQNHRNVLHHIRVYTNNLHIDAEDRLTLLSTYGFDAAVMDIYGALLNGASLYPLDLRAGEIATMATWMKESKISIYHSTPTVYRYFMRALAPRERLEKVRLVVLGGEPVFRTDFERYKQHFTPESIFVNGFGPTESTLSTQFFLNHTSPIERNAIPIGYAVENTDILLVNEAGEDVEVYGEIAIRSPHIALGYWQKPDVTEAAFLPDPDGGNNRIYRTGDTGRLLPQGEIEFIGRKDTQVKIRGFRVELGEIEAELVRHPSIKEAAAIVHEDESGDRRIAAFLVAQDEHAPGTKEIRSYLGTKLPDYMLPASIQYLQEMPITQTGKLDRRALYGLDLVPPESEAPFVAPRTRTEVLLADLWAQVLGVNQVGIHDDFFELGGHSLLATRVMARVRDDLGVALSLRSLFEAPTVASIARLIEIRQWAAQSARDQPEGARERLEEFEL